MDYKCGKAHAIGGTIILICTVLGCIFAGVAVLVAIRARYDIDATAASRYTYQYESGGRIDIGTYKMEKGRLEYAVEFVYDDVPHTCTVCTYNVSYKKGNGDWVKKITGLALRHGSHAGCYYFLTNSKKDAKYDIKIEKTSGLDRRTSIDLLVVKTD